MEAFVYIWTNNQNNKKYIGCHKGTPDDGYICSSKVMLDDYKKNPHHFSREILATGSWKDMADLEVKLQQKYNVRYNDEYYNQGVSRAIILSEEQIKKTADMLRGRKLSEEHKQKLSQALKGRSWSEEYKKNMSEVQKQRWKNREYTEQERINRSNAQKAREPAKLLTRKKMSESGKGKIWITDGIQSTKIYPEDTIPDGWYRGRNYKRKK